MIIYLGVIFILMPYEIEATTIPAKKNIKDTIVDIFVLCEKVIKIHGNRATMHNAFCHPRLKNNQTNPAIMGAVYVKIRKSCAIFEYVSSSL